MLDYTDQKFWSHYYSKDKYMPEFINGHFLSPLFHKFLEKNTNKTLLEIGCAGGKALCYLSKIFQYKAHGIDYIDEIEKTRSLFKFNNLPEPILFKEDFFNWHPDVKFDVVCSIGFVEHFEDINSVIAKHADLVAPEGKLIITLPNFAKAQYLFHWLIDRNNLGKHNIKIMNLSSIREALKPLPLKIEYLNYYKPYGFWTERKKLKPWEKIIFVMIRKFGKAINVIFGYDRPNRWFSPHIVLVAIKQVENRKLKVQN